MQALPCQRHSKAERLFRQMRHPIMGRPSTNVLKQPWQSPPHKSVDIVIANAGVGRGPGDPMMQLEGELPQFSHEHGLCHREVLS